MSCWCRNAPPPGSAPRAPGQENRGGGLIPVSTPVKFGVGMPSVGAAELLTADIIILLLTAVIPPMLLLLAVRVVLVKLPPRPLFTGAI